MITSGVNNFLFHGLNNCATGLMDVGAIVEFTVLLKLSEFREVFRNFLLFQIYYAKVSNSWGINDLGSIYLMEHFCESGSMFSFFVRIRNFANAGICLWVQGVE